MTAGIESSHFLFIALLKFFSPVLFPFEHLQFVKISLSGSCHSSFGRMFEFPIQIQFVLAVSYGFRL